MFATKQGKPLPEKSDSVVLGVNCPKPADDGSDETCASLDSWHVELTVDMLQYLYIPQDPFVRKAVQAMSLPYHLNLGKLACICGGLITPWSEIASTLLHSRHKGFDR